MTDRNNGQATGRNSKGRFTSGNPGRPRGARNKATLAAEKLLQGEAEDLTRAAIELAKAGDSTALRLCLERIVPPIKEASIQLDDLPSIDSASDLPKAVAALLSAVAGGRLTPSEAKTMAGVIGEVGKALELHDIEERLAELEARQ